MTSRPLWQCLPDESVDHDPNAYLNSGFAHQLPVLSADESRIGKARAFIIGITAALRAPLRIRGSRLRSTIGDGPIAMNSGNADAELVLALRAANRMTGELARTRTLWRDTCLYHSMAQYLVLRAFGLSASIRIGVRNSDNEDIHAHSWVAYGGPRGSAGRRRGISRAPLR